MMSFSEIATHQAPVWKGKANYLIHVDLADHGLKGRMEQLWARQIANDEFELCCVPFFTYGFALGDILATRRSNDMDHIVSHVVRQSGRRLVRLWLKYASSAGTESVYEYLIKAAAFHEWSSEYLVAIDISPVESRDPERLLAFLEEGRRNNIEIEWGN